MNQRGLSCAGMGAGHGSFVVKLYGCRVTLGMKDDSDASTSDPSDSVHHFEFEPSLMIDSCLPPS